MPCTRSRITALQKEHPPSHHAETPTQVVPAPQGRAGSGRRQGRKRRKGRQPQAATHTSCRRRGKTDGCGAHLSHKQIGNCAMANDMRAASGLKFHAFHLAHDKPGHESNRRRRQPGVRVVTLAPSGSHRRKRRSPLAGRPSHAVGFLHPRRDIALDVQHTPDINVIWTLDEEHEGRMAHQRPSGQPRQIQCVGAARRTGGRVAADLRTRSRRTSK